MQSRAERKRRLNDLYIDGRTVELLDGTTLYLRALNPYERNEVARDAAAAKSRFVLAVKHVGSDEYNRARGSFFDAGRDASVEALLNLKHDEWIVEAANSVRDDPEWEERIEVLDRSDELFAREQTDPERKLLVQIQSDFVDELNLRYDGRRQSEKAERTMRTDEELLEEYCDLWADVKASDIANAEFQLGELWHAIRLCDATRTADGEDWEHSKCDGHRQRLYLDKSEVVELPSSLQALLMDEMNLLNLSVREAKNSDRQGSFSDSSPLPSEAAESEPSIETEASQSPPGTSPQPSLTP